MSYVYTEELAQYATTERQRQCLAAVLEHGTQRAAADALGMAQSGLHEHLKSLRAHAARKGYAPGHFTSGVPEGYLQGKVTVQRNAAGEVMQTWERMSPDQLQTIRAVTAIIEEAATEIPRAAPRPFTGDARADLLTQYTFTDYHLGMRATAAEGGADWNLAIAEELLVRVFAHQIAASPAAAVGLICQLGDFMHFDGLLPVTPTSRHVLDADAHFQDMVRAAMRCLRRLVDMALEKHEKVVVLAAEGNHDIASSIWMREALKIIYEREPRVEIIDSLSPYYVYQWGETMLAFHHGHMKKFQQLPAFFAAEHPKVWGNTRHRYGHSGHYHHELEKADVPGMKWLQHPTLAARDSHCVRGAYGQSREAIAITYSKRTGRVGSVNTTPEMVEDDLPIAA